MKKYLLISLTLLLLVIAFWDVAGAAVANPPKGAKRKIIPPPAIYPATPVNVVNVVEQPPATVIPKGGISPSPSPSPTSAKATPIEEPPPPKQKSKGFAILLIALIALIILGSGGIFIFQKMQAAKERDF